MTTERNPEDVTWVAYPANIEWIVVRNSSEFVDKFWYLMKSGKDYIVSFDHDIQEFCGKKELTGYTNLKGMLNAIQYYNLTVLNVTSIHKIQLAKEHGMLLSKFY